MYTDVVPAAVRAIERVMCATGPLVISSLHPIEDHVRFSNVELDAPFVFRIPLRGRQCFEGVAERDGLGMRFAG